MSISDWMYISEYLALFLRARIAGPALTGSASINGQDVVGFGTAFTSEAESGDWLRFDGLPGRAFRIAEVASDAQILLAGTGAVHGPDTMTVCDTAIHQQVKREQQELPYLLVSASDLQLREFCEKRNIEFQVMAAADTNAGVVALAGAALRAIPEGPHELLPPDGKTRTLCAAWMHPADMHNLGEQTTGQHYYSINYNLRGREND